LIRSLAEKGYESFADVGSRKVLAVLLKCILPEATVMGISTVKSLRAETGKNS
jgi:hypothetical protein